MSLKTFSRKYRRLFSRFDIKLKIVDEVPCEFQAPFSSDIGLDRENRIVYCSKDNPAYTEAIHETGHLLWDDLVKAEEYDFLGWEYYVAQILDAVDNWYMSMGAYQISHPNNPRSAWNIVEFDSLTPDEKKLACKQAVHHSRKLIKLFRKHAFSVGQ